MHVWEQVYNPLENIWLSAIIAAVPIIVFIVLLTVFKLKGYIAGLFSIIAAGIFAVFIYKMPAILVLMSAIYGILVGLWPVASIVFAAIFLYKISVKTGKFAISISFITADQRIASSYWGIFIWSIFRRSCRIWSTRCHNSSHFSGAWI
ncbi:L-lactate permease [Aeribacillus sp. FSL W8-0870]|uniref:L-lactate permease n=1 Tax=Aeribacillus sp. FSL W8-0870 TaxID=2954706 RepID=UPI0030CBA3D2